MTICTNCNLPKDENDFNFRNKAAGIRHKHCRMCHSDYRRRHYLNNRTWYIDKASKWNTEHWLYHTFKKSCLAGYKGTLRQFEDEYNAIAVKQGGLCAICEKPVDNPQADHCHKTGKLRGLLCTNCNWGLGQFKDSCDLLCKAIKYLGD